MKMRHQYQHQHQPRRGWERTAASVGAAVSVLVEPVVVGIQGMSYGLSKMNGNQLYVC